MIAPSSGNGTVRGIRSLLLFILTFGVAKLVTGVEPNDQAAWRDRIYVPTAIEKVHDHYMIVACWQHRIIFSPDIDRPISAWRTLSEDLAGPHSVAVTGEYLLTEDTARHAVVLYRWDGVDYQLVQRLTDLPQRPHRVLWHEPSQAFWVVGCNNQTLYKLAFDRAEANEPLRVAEVHPLDFQEGAYTRSMTIHDDRMLFVAGGAARLIHEVDFMHGALTVVNTYRVPDVLGLTGQMNDIFRSSDGWWYFTSTNTQALIRARSLADLDAGRFEDVKAEIGLEGTPYYLAEFDGRIWVPSIYQTNGITSFRHGPEGQIADVVHHFMFGPATPADIVRQDVFPR